MCERKSNRYVAESPIKSKAVQNEQDAFDKTWDSIDVNVDTYMEEEADRVGIDFLTQMSQKSDSPKDKRKRKQIGWSIK